MMMATILAASIGFLLAGLLAVGYGISVKEFSFGSTLILAGVIGACTGAVMLVLGLVVRELKNIASRLAAGISAIGAARRPAPGHGDVLSSLDQPSAQDTGSDEAHGRSDLAPWQQHATSHDQVRDEGPPQAAAATVTPKQRRNLLFASTSRKERDRAHARASEPVLPDMLTAEVGSSLSAMPTEPQSNEAPPATFDDAWPKSDRSRPPGARNGDQSAVTVLKSGVVDGMAYSLYSDGSIEAQMPEGLMRFGSIDELRSHLDQR